MSRRQAGLLSLAPSLRTLTLLQRFALTSLVVFVVIGFGTARIIAVMSERSALSAAETAAFNGFQALRGPLRPGDLQGRLTGRRLANFNRLVTDNVLNDRTKVVKIWNPQGIVVYATDPKIVGRQFPLERDVRIALRGGRAADVANLSAAEDVDQRTIGPLLQVYIPIRFGHGPVEGAFEIYQTYGPVAAQVASLQTVTSLILGAGLFVLYVVLFGIVRAGSRTISRQQKVLETRTHDLEHSYADTIRTLAAAIDARDSETELHSERVTALALRLGKYIGLDQGSLRKLSIGAQLHDIGKIGIPDAILLKPGPLGDEEWELMRRHPLIGYDMIRDVAALSEALPVVRHHHERWDGTGYPDGLKGEEIPLAARVFSVVDAFDAITANRPYRRGSSAAEAMSRIETGAGIQFDPLLAVGFIAMMSRSRRAAHTASRSADEAKAA